LTLATPGQDLFQVDLMVDANLSKSFPDYEIDGLLGNALGANGMDLNVDYDIRSG
jgi:hypothetical protein